MFAKVFGQIFDSSIAEDYNCRRMFMDLLVLADPSGVVDMTLEAISRRTNVPLDEVTKYITELQQPDASSRSRLEDGKRIVKISDERDWGWQIVNYHHYKKIRDAETLRSYFRDAQRKRREKIRKAQGKPVKDKVLTDLDTVGQSLTERGRGVGGIGYASASSSLSKEVQNQKGKAASEKEVVDFAISRGLTETDGHWFWDKCEGCGWTNNRKAIKDWKATIRQWQAQGNIFPSQRHIRTGNSSIPECLKFSHPRDWQEARRIKRYLETCKSKHPEHADKIQERIDSLNAQYKLS